MRLDCQNFHSQFLSISVSKICIISLIPGCSVEETTKNIDFFQKIGYNKIYVYCVTGIAKGRAAVLRFFLFKSKTDRTML